MLYHPPTGSLDPNAPYVGKNVAAGIQGSKVPPGAIETTQREIVNAVVAAGLAPTDTDLFQLTRAIRGGQLDFAADVGTADAMVARLILPHSQIKTGLPFSIVKGPLANTGAVAPTLTITDLNGNNAVTGTLLKATGGAINKADLPPGALLTMRAVAPGVFALTSLMLASDVLALILANGIVGRTKVFTSSGSFQLPPGVDSIEVEAIGGGGAGGATNNSTAGGTLVGNAGGGGGGGGYGYGRFSNLTLGAVFPVTVGLGGAGLANAGGGAGGLSAFSSFLAAYGGGGGPFGSGTQAYGGAGGGATGGLFNIPGGQGGASGNNTNATPTQSQLLVIYTRGGLAPRGFGSIDLCNTGGTGQGYGNGGSGASGGQGLKGGDGAPGLVIVRW